MNGAGLVLSDQADSTPAPVAPGDRHEIIDIVRGFALFGVLLANMVLTTQFLAITDAQRDALPTAQLDAAVLFLTGTLVDGKFFTIFSMLFGLGFAVQLTRASRRGTSVLPVYSRRLGLLFAVGVLHATLLWFGDVLHIYALLGFVLILLRNRSDRTILIGAAALMLAVMLLPLLDWVAESQGLERSMIFGRELPPAEVYDTLKHGGYADVVGLNWDTHLRDYGELGFGGNILFWYLDILSKFLIGFCIGRRMLLQRASEHLGMFRRGLPWLLVLGLGGSVYMHLGWSYDIGEPASPLLRVVLQAFHELWILSLSLGYVCSLVLLHQNPRWCTSLRLLAPVGRMALTNYLTHSLCFLALFYGVGAGLLGDVGAAGCLLFSLVIFSSQVALSVWWLKRYRFGPAEWAWRSLTYAKPQPFRKAAPAEPS